MTMESMFFQVRTGHGTCSWTGTTFTDTVDETWRVPRQHVGWQSVAYKGKRYQLHGGIRTDWFICLNNPIRGSK